jgi:hypothetical protein
MMFEKPSMRRYVPCSEVKPDVPELWEDETIDYELSDVELSFSASKPPVGQGKLFITSKRVIWMQPGESGAAFDFDVPYIVLHAISRDVDSYPKPCIYCQLDCCQSDDEEDEENTEDAIDEIFLAPSCDTVLKDMFNAFSAAALNNPDPDEEGQEEGDDELIYNVDEVQLGAEQSRTLNHLESIFNVPTEFEGVGSEVPEQQEGDGTR